MNTKLVTAQLICALKYHLWQIIDTRRNEIDKNKSRFNSFSQVVCKDVTKYEQFLC